LQIQSIACIVVGLNIIEHRSSAIVYPKTITVIIVCLRIVDRTIDVVEQEHISLCMGIVEKLAVIDDVIFSSISDIYTSCVVVKLGIIE